MKFLCDVHISYKFSKHLSTLGFVSEHINFLLSRWNTPDGKIAEYADKQNCILISKDSDFKDSHFLRNSPKKLIRIVLGNISNSELISIFDLHISKIQSLDSLDSFYLEISRDRIQIIS